MSNSRLYFSIKTKDADNVEKILMFSGLNKIVNHYSNIEEGINDMRGGII